MNLVEEFTGTRAVQMNDIYTIEALIEGLNRMENSSSPVRVKVLQAMPELSIYYDSRCKCHYAKYYGNIVAYKNSDAIEWKRIL